jgi:hypothetical protein
MIQKWREIRRYFTSGPTEGEPKVVGVFAERLRELLPDERFNVVVDGSTIVVHSQGDGTHIFTPVLIWRTSLPVDERLRLVFEALGKGVQRLLGTVQGAEWGSLYGDVRVEVTSDMIKIWWGDKGWDDALMRIRPVCRQELGV